MVVLMKRKSCVSCACPRWRKRRRPSIPSDATIGSMNLVWRSGTVPAGIRASPPVACVAARNYDRGEDKVVIGCGCAAISGAPSFKVVVGCSKVALIMEAACGMV